MCVLTELKAKTIYISSLISFLELPYDAPKRSFTFK
jgi:hypothetical protein